jgi:hypothetical protein
MRGLRALYHLVRADFLERVRRFRFLLVLGVMLLGAYLLVPPAEASYMVGLHPANVNTWTYYRGVYNSAWVGSTVGAMTAWLLSLLGFYLARGAIERDRRTGVGQLIAASPLSRTSYAVGKWLSNVAVLAVMVVSMGVASGAVQLIRGEAMELRLAELLAPFLWLTLPPLVFVAALAVLFETLPGLRGGLGNAVYALAWFVLAVPPFGFTRITGLNLIERSVLNTLRALHPDGSFDASYGVNPAWAGTPQTFHWAGVRWTLKVMLGRLGWVGAALAVVAVASLALTWAERELGVRLRLGRRGSEPSDRGHLAGAREGAEPLARQVSIAPLPAEASRFRFTPVLRAELRLALRGQPWWWYLGALGWAVGGLLASADAARAYLLPAAWLWPLLIWSVMGTRAARYRTDELVFSTPRPLRRQLPAIWLGGVVVAVVTGSGVALRLMLDGLWPAVFAWAVGALFVPTLALTLGVWSGSGKAFEGLYTALWYVGPVNQLTALDFLGATDEAVSAGVPLAYLALTLVLMGLAVVGRRRQLRQ